MIDELDRKIISLIINDARTPFLEVARECGVSGAAIHQRIQKLTSLGVILGTQFNVDPEKIGLSTCAYLGMSLEHPEKMERTMEKLQSVREIVECHHTSGSYDLLLKVYAESNHQLLRIIHEKLQPLGLICKDTIMSFNEAIHRPVSIL